MPIIALTKTPNSFTNHKLIKVYTQFAALIEQLKLRTLPTSIETPINDCIHQINFSVQTETQLCKLIIQKQTLLLKQIEKELKIVPKNYYRNLWMIMGMSAFGLPIGVSFGLAMKNLGLLGVGLPFGMGIGIAVGLKLDKKALKEGRQLNIEIKN